MAFPIITLLLAVVVAFLAFQTSSIDIGLPEESSAPVTMSEDVVEDEGASEE